MGWTQSWCTGAPIQWPTAQPRAAAGAKPTALSDQSLSGRRRVLQRTLHHPQRGTARFHSRGLDYWLPPYGLHWKCNPQEVTWGTEERKEQKWIQPWTSDLLRIVLVWCLFSLLAGAIVWKSVFTRALDRVSPCPSRTWYSPGANNRESRILTRLSTLQMSV